MNSSMMNFIHVTVMVQDIIWDEFLLFQDNSKCEILDSIKTNELFMPQHKAVTLITSCINKDKHIYGPEIMKDANKLNNSSYEEESVVTLHKWELRKPKCVQKLCINGYLLSLFVKTLQQSEVYRRSVINNFIANLKKGKMSPRNGIMELHIKLVCSHKQIIDFVWNQKLEWLVLERMELDNAMSWLSTLGGAFSALGEEFKHCAEIAGCISVQQFSIALRLGDPMTVARCKLYFALSLVQRGHLASARHIIYQQYHLARSAPVQDSRLISMCLGIWARLKYEYHRRRKERKK